MKRLICLTILFCAVILAPVAKAGQAQQTPPATTTHHTTTTHTGTDPALLHPAMLKATAPAEYDVKFVTTKGDFVVHVTRAWAPNGADRFYNLVKHHFYDGVTFYRAVPGFMVQFGLTGNPAVNRAWDNATIKDDPVKQSNKPGYITYAAAASPNTRTTQVFINYADNNFLDTQRFAPFGQVTSGMEVVQQFYSGYGDTANDQGNISEGGKSYIDKKYPKLDSVKSATVVSPAGTTPATPAHKPASGSTGAKPQS